MCMNKIEAKIEREGENMENSNSIDRRSFLAGAGAVAAAGAAVALTGSKAAFADEAEDSEDSEESAGTYTAGTYTATATGLGEVTITVTFDETSITAVELDVSNETETIGQAAADELIEQVLAAQSADIEGVSGATLTSTAVSEGVADCIAQASGTATEDETAEEEGEEESSDSDEESTYTYKPSWLGDAPVIDESEITETIEADIVVVGGGNAGSMCAFAAAEAGATVAVIEQQSEEGITYYGLHDIASINSDYALSNGVPEINKTEFLAEYQRRSHNRTNPRLVKKFVYNSGEMVDWLMANMPEEVCDAVTIHNLTSNQDYLDNGGEINRFSCWTGTVQIDYNSAAPTLIAQAEEQGATWYWEYTGVVLETEEGTTTERAETTADDGTVTFYDKEVPQTTVTGVIATDPDGNYVRFNASKGVVLSCGDYGGNAEMYEDLQDEKRWLWRSHGLDTSEMQCASFGRDGSGIKMALWAGGTMDPGPRTLVDPQVMFSSDTYASNVLRWGAGFNGADNPWGAPFVWFDQEGRRFTDETFLGIFGQRIRAERSKPGRYYIIFDSHWEELMSRSAPEHFSLPVGAEEDIDLAETFASWVERGAEGAEENEGSSVCAWGAETLDELLEYMPLEDDVRETIASEIERYNEFCENGEDEDFGRDPQMLLPIDEGPFYGMYCVEEKPMTGTVALNGVTIDEDQRVLDTNYNPIVNLYASGNNSGGRFAIEYSTPLQGLTLGMAMTLGRVLGQELAEA